jgi:hypothetical protein
MYTVFWFNKQINLEILYHLKPSSGTASADFYHLLSYLPLSFSSQIVAGGERQQKLIQDKQNFLE